VRTALARLPFLLCLAITPAAAAVTSPADVSLLVAPFERVAPSGTTLPDIALLLADRLGTRGVGRVVGPGQMGLQPVAEPSAEMLRTWASAANVGLVVTGSSTRVGRRTSLDLRLHAAGTGTVLGTYVAEAAQPEELEAAVDRLAEQIVTGALGAAEAPAPGAPAVALAAAEPGAATAQVAAGPAADDDGGSGFLGVGGGSRNDEPIAIKSDELEALQQGGERRFLFKRNVRAVQGDMVLTSRELEAYYPAGASHPERLVATGKVKLTQQGKEAHCDRATYFRAQQKVLCTGDNVELLQKGDRVRGKEIEFYLDTDRLLVRGGADVFLESGDTPGGPGTGSAAPARAEPATAPSPAAAGTGSEAAPKVDGSPE
jgi:lipopolysaccharide transport protein LptA